MKVVLFCHSIVSDWNNGNAHFLRGIVRELLGRGHSVDTCEPLDGWSRSNLVAAHGRGVVDEVYDNFGWLRAKSYDPRFVELDPILEGADLVLVHEWNDPLLVKAIGDRRLEHGYRLLFHDTHHRSVTAPEQMRRYDLSSYDGVLAFGNVVREVYLANGWAKSVWVWHEAADAELFQPRKPAEVQQDLVWIGNWGDGERSHELYSYLLEPSRKLDLRSNAYGVRYPAEAVSALSAAGVSYKGWLPNHRVPDTFAHHRATVHIPRRPYSAAMPGIPTIRPFEALACAIPLVSAPWQDSDKLFRAGEDFLMAKDEVEMTSLLDEVLHDDDLASQLSASGLETVLSRHTCRHRAIELLDICVELGMAV